MSSSESWVVFISTDKALNYSALDWMPNGNTYCTQTAGATVSLTYECELHSGSRSMIRTGGERRRTLLLDRPR